MDKTQTKSVDGHAVLWEPDEIARRLENDSVIGFDTETTGLSPWRDSIALIQLYGENTGTLGLVRVYDGVIPEPIKALFAKPESREFVAHNGVGFDLLMLETHGVDWERAKWYDTLVGETLVLPAGRSKRMASLRSSVKRRLGLELNKDIAHGGWANNDLDESQILYACSDVLSLPALMRSQREKAAEQKQTNALEMEMELLPCMAKMTINGMPLRPEVLREYIASQKDPELRLRMQIQETLGSINLNSPAQLKKAIFRVTGIELPSTAREVLYDLAHGYIYASDELSRIAGLILEWRSHGQVLKMYNEDWIRDKIVADRVHARFWQTGTDTFRISSTDPNLQQTPRRMRKVYGNIDGYSVVGSDYSQIEVRIAAEIANDEVLLNAFRTDDDIHRQIAAVVYGIDPEQVTTDQRKKAKALVFGLLFGGTESTLYRHSKSSGGNLTADESLHLMTQFFKQFQGLKRQREKAVQLARSPYPVILRLPNSARRVLVGQSKRHTVILNTLVQGSAAIGLKYGLIDAYKTGLAEYLGGTVHDENVAFLETKYAEDFGKELESSMIRGMSRVIKTRVKCDVKIGSYWE